MVDIVSPDVRSRMMSGIRGTNTNPELLLRRGLFAKGFRYKLHTKGLSGKPDLVFPKYGAVLFAHGCFWHGHDCHLFRMPSTRREFWEAKIARNRTVDEKNEAALKADDWRCGVVWECALKGRTRLPYLEVIDSCASWLDSRKPSLEIRGAQ